MKVGSPHCGSIKCFERVSRRRGSVMAEAEAVHASWEDISVSGSVVLALDKTDVRSVRENYKIPLAFDAGSRDDEAIDNVDAVAAVDGNGISFCFIILTSSSTDAGEFKSGMRCPSAFSIVSIKSSFWIAFLKSTSSSGRRGKSSLRRVSNTFCIRLKIACVISMSSLRFANGL